MVFSRENLILHFSNVCLNSPAYYLPHVRVPFYILRPEPRNAQHIRCDKYLTIAARSGANANRGDSQRFGNLSCQVGWGLRVMVKPLVPLGVRTLQLKGLTRVLR